MMSFEDHLLNGIYNIGDALWAIFGGLVILAGLLLYVGVKIAKALLNRDNS